MAQATLTVTLPERVWVHQLSTAYSGATFRVLAAVPGADSGFALVRITGSDLEAILEAMIEHPQISNLEVAQRTDGEVTVHFENSMPLLLLSSRKSGVPIELPLEVQNGQATIDVTGSRERLSRLVEQLADLGFQYRIDHVHEHRHDGQLLSDRQREVVVAAVEQGYYDTPRRSSLTELADHLHIAKSTCSETLHRAEEAIVKQFVDDLPAPETDRRAEDPLAGH